MLSSDDLTWDQRNRILLAWDGDHGDLGYPVTVERPDGTSARPSTPPAMTSTCTVGSPRQSSTSRAMMLEIDRSGMRPPRASDSDHAAATEDPAHLPIGANDAVLALVGVFALGQGMLEAADRSLQEKGKIIQL